jgi:hypothetical protein
MKNLPPFFAAKILPDCLPTRLKVNPRKEWRKTVLSLASLEHTGAAERSPIFFIIK